MFPDFFTPGPSFIPEGDTAEIDSLLGAYFDSSTLGFCIVEIVEGEFRYVAVNQALAQKNGCAPEEHAGKLIREILGPLADPVEAELQRVLATGKPRLDVQMSGSLPGKAETIYWIGHVRPVKLLE